MTPDSSKQINFVDIVTQFYCSLSGKKDIQKITDQISEFVLNHQQIQDKDGMGKRILQYFLKLYSKSKISSEQDWDNTFQFATAQSRAALFIANFPTNKLYKQSFRILSQNTVVSEVYSETIWTQISGNQTTIFDDIEVEEDVKLKTKYFFKWCLYHRGAKEFQYQRQRSAQNLNLSRSFNLYGTKFNYFTAWKRLYKKRKTDKERVCAIESNKKQILLTKYLRKLNECGQILMIQEQLTSKVKTKLQTIRKVETFKSLSRNNQAFKLLSSRNYGINIYAYHLINFCTKGITKKMNKSYIVQRNKLQKNYSKTILQKIINHFKDRISEGQQRRHQIATNIKSYRLVEMMGNFRVAQMHKAKRQSLQKYLSSKKCKLVITILHFYYVSQQQKQQQERMMNCHSDHRIVYVSKQKQFRKKETQFQDYLQARRKGSFFAVQKIKKIENQNYEVKRTSILKLLLKRLYTQKRRNTEARQQRAAYFRYLKVVNQKIIYKRVLARWAKISQYNQAEKNHLNTLLRIGNRKLQRTFLKKLQARATQQERLNQFAGFMKLMIFRVCFGKIGGRTFKINKQVEGLIKLRNKKLQLDLFEMLVVNSGYNCRQADKIGYYRSCQNQSEFFSKLRGVREFAAKKKCLARLIETNKKISYTKHFVSQIRKDHLINYRQNLVSSKAFVSYLQQNYHKRTQIRKDFKQKEENLQTFLEIRAVENFYQGLKKKCAESLNDDRKVYNLIVCLAKKGINQIQNAIKIIKGNKSIKENIQVLEKSRKHEFVKQYKGIFLTAKIKKTLAVAAQHKLYQCLTNRLQHQNQINLKTNKLLRSIFSGKANLLMKKVTSQIEELKIKERKLSKHLNLCDKMKKKGFITQLIQHKQNVEANGKLLRAKTHRHLSELVTTFFKRKYGKIKYHYSLKFYATNLIKKSIKSLKKNHDKIRYKENIVKLDRTSSIAAEKSIEKSFKSNSLSEQIEKFNIRKSRQLR